MGFKTCSWVLVFSAVVLFLPALVAAGTVELPQTGMTRCYDTTGTEIACAGTGQDGEFQEGVAWPNPRFTDNADGTVTDNLTGLMWTKDAGTPTYGSCTGGTKNWQSALEYVSCLNSNAYLGYSDWRLPNINEIESLYYVGAAGTDSAAWLNSQGFINVGSSNWSSTTCSSNTTYAWNVYFGGNYTGISAKTTAYYTWPVR